MTPSLETQVLIVGAGPTGLLLAAGLARYGIKARLVDKNPEPVQSSRAIGVFARTIEIFDDLGIAEDAIAQSLPLQGFYLYAEGKSIAHLDLQQRRTCFPNALSLLQSDTEAILTNLVERLGVKIERSTTLVGLEQDAEGVTARLTHPDGAEERCRTAWLIGCDGARSTVRKEVGLEDRGTTLPASFILADVEKKWELAPAEAHICLASDGVMAIFPLPQENHWRIIASWPHETLPDDPELPLFEELVRRRSHLPPQLSQALWTSSFRVRQRMVTQARKGRVLVAGDALSSHSPLGGQGMNTGLQDAYNLAWKLAAVLHNRANSSLLDSYAAERLPISQKLLIGTGLATRFMLIDRPGLRQIRGIIPSMITRLAPLRDLLPTHQIPEAVTWQGSVLLDRQTLCHQHYGASRECLYLIRPDGYIGYRSQSIAISQLKLYLQKLTFIE
jgi:2-polyprenyl-6-methoxyphenol hydroxylase-like FAD-dependent oxidoreductase